jgi:hypothetical protein
MSLTLGKAQQKTRNSIEEAIIMIETTLNDMRNKDRIDQTVEYLDSVCDYLQDIKERLKVLRGRKNKQWKNKQL